MKKLTLKLKLLASLMMMSLPLSVLANDTLKAINAEGNSHIESVQLISKTDIPKAAGRASA